MNPMNVMEPNNLGVEFENIGLDSLITNTGWGVPKVAAEQEHENEQMKVARRGAARQYGKPMDKVF